MNKNFNDNKTRVIGWINNVRINDTENGQKAINLFVNTQRVYDTDEGTKKLNTVHRAVIFTDDKKLIKKFSGIAKDIAANIENKDAEGYKPKNHAIAFKGYLRDREAEVVVDKDGNKETYRTTQTVVYPKTIEFGQNPNALKADGDVANRVDFTGNIASIDKSQAEKHGFVNLFVINHFVPETEDGEKKPSVDTHMNFTVNGNHKNKDIKQLYNDIMDGKIGVGDFVSVGGQLVNNDQAIKFKDAEGNEKVAYKNRYDVVASTFDLRYSKKEVEEVEQTPAKKTAKKAEPKKTTAAKKPEAAKKAAPAKKTAKVAKPKL